MKKEEAEYGEGMKKVDNEKRGKNIIKTEEEYEENIMERIFALSTPGRAKLTEILKDLKRMKEEGKTEADYEVVAKVLELEEVLGKK